MQSVWWSCTRTPMTSISPTDFRRKIPPFAGPDDTLKRRIAASAGYPRILDFRSGVIIEIAG